MQESVSASAQLQPKRSSRASGFFTYLRSQSPSLSSCGVALISAALLIAAFPDFDLWPLAWIALVPLLIVIVRDPKPTRAFLLGWLFGSVFFFGSCYWLTYSIIHYGGFSPLIAYPILVPGALVLGVFPGLFALFVTQVVKLWGTSSVWLAPLFWVPLEWARLALTGQLWNAIGYSQAFHPALIGPARFGGVYAVGFLIVFVNAACAYAATKRTRDAIILSAIAILIFCIGPIAFTSLMNGFSEDSSTTAYVIAIQPNVPMDLIKTTAELEQLRLRHFNMSETALRNLRDDQRPRLIIWPESPMNFTYGADPQFREVLKEFAKKYNTAILLNSQETAPNEGIYNSAMLINEEGSLVAQYDKIRLLPFGEYVPLPQWIPGSSLIRGIVGDFTPGANYRLMPVGSLRAGVFICIESAYPAIARQFTVTGADVLINISNDGYLGRTAVMRQHLANAVFRSVENNRPLLRVTNTGITASISPRGFISDETQPFQAEVRTWTIARNTAPPSFYARHGDVFAAACAVLSFVVLLVSSFKKRSQNQPLA